MDVLLALFVNIESLKVGYRAMFQSFKTYGVSLKNRRVIYTHIQCYSILLNEVGNIRFRRFAFVLIRQFKGLDEEQHTIRDYFRDISVF